MPTYFDSSQLIDLGSAPNANDGDTLRTAGSKINTALRDIDSALDALDSDFRVAFDSSQIGTDAISTAKIQDGAVIASKLTPGSLSNTVYAGSLNFDSAAADDVITINAAGQVGITNVYSWFNDTAPSYQLDVRSSTGTTTANFSSGSNTTINLYSDNNASGPFRFVSQNDALYLKAQAAAISTDNSFIKYDETSNKLRLMSGAYLDNIGNMGIGVAAPQTKLDVNGTIRASNVSSGTPTAAVELISTGGIEITSATSAGYIDLKNNNGEDYDVRLATNSAGDFYISTLGTTKRLTVLDTGEVGIGTDAPTQDLHVVGQILSSVTSGNNNGLSVTTGDNGISYIVLSNSTGNVLLRKDDGFSSIRNNDTDEFRIYGNGVHNFTFQHDGDFFARGDVTAFASLSDRNLKENIENIPNALEKVSKINGVTFNYIGSKESMTGVIAQEVQEVLPEVIYETVDNTREDGRALAVRYGNMVGLLIEAIKELKAEVEQLKNKE